MNVELEHIKLGVHKRRNCGNDKNQEKMEIAGSEGS